MLSDEIGAMEGNNNQIGREGKVTKFGPKCNFRIPAQKGIF